MPTFGPAWNLVPRWRTMIEPAGTIWPPNTLTPSIFGCESRPLRVEPPPFFCAMRKLLERRRSGGVDRADADFGEVLPVALALLVVLALAHLEDADLVVPAVRDDAGDDGGAGDERRAGHEVGARADRQHLVERDVGADVGGEALDPQGLAGRDLVLFAAGFDDRVPSES